MKKLLESERILMIAVGILLLSILLMIIILPGIFYDSAPQANPKGAAIGILLAILIHLIIFAGFIKVIRKTRISTRYKKGEFLAIGILLLVFGFIYLDGAFAFLSHKNIFYVSILMFISVLCDLVASTISIIVYFSKPLKKV
jgi:hypothetical protein